MIRSIGKTTPSLLAGATILSVLSCLPLSEPAVAAGLTVPSGYSISVFAPTPTDASQPDSVAVDGNNVFIGFGNGTSSTGSDGLPTTIAEYTTSGQLVTTFSVPGHNDGLRVDPTTHLVYALLNQDGNPKLTIINPTTGTQTTPNLPANPGSGYDDLQFVNGQIFVSISNPADSTSPILGLLTSSGSTYSVTSILKAGDTVTDSSGNSVTLDPATLDPDSLGVSPSGSLLLDDQGGEALISVSNPGTNTQKVVRLSHSGTSVDDTVFVPTQNSSLLVAATSDNVVYKVSGPFVSGTAYTAASSGNFVGTLDLTGGQITPVFSGIGSPHGLGFAQSVPEPDSVLGMLMLGLLGAGFQLKRLSK